MGAYTDAEIVLRDGRMLAYVESGDAAGWPVVFCPGFMGSRLTGAALSDETRRAGARLLSIDRPGIGRSSPLPRRRLVDTAADAIQLMDSLSVERFSVLGHSGGGPAAAAIASAEPSRVASLAIVSGFAPMDREGAFEGMAPGMARGARGIARAPWVARMVTMGLPRRYRRDPEAAFQKQFGASMSAADREASSRPPFRTMLAESAAEATRQGGAPLATEMQLMFGRPWGFDAARIEAPTILWYGGDDGMTPPPMGRFLAGAIADSTLRILPGEGHMALFTHWAEVLEGLVDVMHQTMAAPLHPLSKKTRHAVDQWEG